MSQTDTETLLRSALHDETIHVHLPPGAAGRALAGARRTRRRRIGVAGALLVVTVCTPVAASRLEDVNSPRSSISTDIMPANYVIGRMEQATLDEMNSVQHIRFTDGAGHPQAWEGWVDTRTGALRQHWFHDDSEHATVPRPDGVAFISVYHTTRTFSKEEHPGFSANTGPYIGDREQVTLMKQQGPWTSVGEETIGGRSAIHLRATIASNPADVWVNDVWVDTKMFVLLKSTKSGVDGSVQSITHVEYLPPTEDNLALTHLAPPAGYREVSPDSEQQPSDRSSDCTGECLSTS
jgi:hypothetical protein